MKLKVTLASNAEGWDKVVNGQLETELARDERVEVSGFVPGNTQKQREHAARSNIKLFDAKPGYTGLTTSEKLFHPPDDLEIDILVMHSYGHHVGKQAQAIRDAKQCSWVLVVHTIPEDLEKYSEKLDPSTAGQDISEHDLQVTLCEKADLVIAVGPKVAEAYKTALRYCGKQESVVTLMPRLPEEFLGVRQRVGNSGEKFRVLISASSKYFKVKGCDIAAKAVKLLNDPLCHLIFVVQEKDVKAEMEQAMVDAGIDLSQLTVRNCSGDTKMWRQQLCQVDLLIKPSRTEGFGISGLRAISADLPVLISGSCGLGVALKGLPSGGKHVVDSNDPQDWAKKIREIRAKGVQTRHEEAEQLRNEYSWEFNWREQCDELVRKFFTLVQQVRGMAYFVVFQIFCCSVAVTKKNHFLTISVITASHEKKMVASEMFYMWLNII